MKASQQDGHYPRPLMVREAWSSLDGPWEFAHDDDDVGVSQGWYQPGRGAFAQKIEVPFPPESSASGIGARGFHPVVWYRRTLPAPARVTESDRVLVHFGAVDHRARVWLDGRLVAEHVGGQTPFTADVTEALSGGGVADGTDHVLVVRAEDDPRAADVPRGKQDWREKPHGIWYERTTGIWQTVWTEVVPAVHLVDLAWTPRPSACVVDAELTLSVTPAEPMSVSVTLTLDDEVLAEVTCLTSDRTTRLTVDVPALRNGQDRDRLAWSPERPTLVDAQVRLLDRAGQQVDQVAGYLGLREVGVRGGAFTLNGTPCYTRSVLDQGYRPGTHLASRGSDELRAEVETIKAMGFNAVRVHQKAEDPRFHYWADRLGLLVWGETAGAYAFSPEAVELLTKEWMDLVRRYRSHPSVVVWVPVNESWGVQDIGTDLAQQQLAQALVSLTRALDPSRPAISNEGWEHVDSDILGLHDYGDADTLRSRYGDRASAHDVVLSQRGPAGRRPTLTASQRRRFLEGRAPLMITEFGGVSMSDEAASWGYHRAASTDELAEKLTALFDALHESTELAGFCYTQLRDTGLETNGLLHEDGSPKLPLEQVRRIVTGEETHPS